MAGDLWAGSAQWLCICEKRNVVMVSAMFVDFDTAHCGGGSSGPQCGGGEWDPRLVCLAREPSTRRGINRNKTKQTLNTFS